MCHGGNNIDSNVTVKGIAVDGSSLGADGNFLHPDGACFRSVSHFHSCLDDLRRMLQPFESCDIEDEENPERSVQYWKKDTLAVLQEILENERLSDKCTWAPVRKFNGERERVYTDLYDTNWWWETQVRTQVISDLTYDRPEYRMPIQAKAARSFRS